MTREEIKKAIESGESVWVVDEPNNIEKVKPISIEKSANRDFLYLKYKYYTSKYYDTDEFYYGDFECFFKSKAEAEHYLHHANVSRSEQLPFLTWEEFVENKKFYFYDEGFVLSKLSINDEKIVLSQAPDSGQWDILKPIKEWDLTEANFYKAYDEAVRLFKGEE